jgi:diguanylate cyclase (GGDEF)-like protein
MNEHTNQTPGLDAQLLEEILRHALDGVAVVDSVNGATRIVYANATLAGLLRRNDDWLPNRLLEDIEVEAPADPNLTATGIGARVRLKRVDGSFIDCERWAVLLAGSRVALYYRPLPRSAPGALAAALDRSSGLSSEQQLFDLLGRDWSIGQRDGRTVTLMRFEIDAWAEYQEVFGRSASDNLLRQVGRTIASVTRRASDVVARTGPGGFIVLGVSMDAAAAFTFADQIVGRLRALAIHHPRSATGRFVTVSAGVVTCSPPRGISQDALLEATRAALGQARAAGGNQAVRGEI